MEDFRDVERKAANGYCKATRTVVVPFRDATGQFMESGGIQEVWNTFRGFSMDEGIRHQDFVDYIDRSVLPGLQSVKRDVKAMLKSIIKDKRLRSTHLYHRRMQTDQLVSKLDSIIHADSQMPDTAYRHPDPLLVNCAVYQSYKVMNDEENTLHDNVLNLQREMALFEQGIIENCRGICQRLLDFRVNNNMEDGSVFGSVITAFNQLGPDTEWRQFYRRNKYHLISEKAPYKSDQDIQYRNQHDELVQPIKVGLLERKTGVMRNWTEGLYVLTPGKLYMHESIKALLTNLENNKIMQLASCMDTSPQSNSMPIHKTPKSQSLSHTPISTIAATMTACMRTTRLRCVAATCIRV